MTKTLEYIIPQNLTNIQTITDLIDLTHKTLNLNELKTKHAENSLFFKVEFNIMILYTLVCTTIVFSIIILRNKIRTIKVYEPEIAQNSSVDDKSKNDIVSTTV